MANTIEGIHHASTLFNKKLFHGILRDENRKVTILLWLEEVEGTALRITIHSITTNEVFECFIVWSSPIVHGKII